MSEAGKREGLSALLARVEAATGPDRDLSTAINRALRQPDEERLGTPERLASVAPNWGPHVTASIDAAVHLTERVLPGWWWTTGDCALTHDAALAPPGAAAIGLGHAIKAMLGPDFRTTAGAAMLAEHPELDAGIDVARLRGNVPLAIVEALLRAKLALA